MSRRWIALGAIVGAGCSSGERTTDGQRVVRIDRPDLPLVQASKSELERFKAGDALFETTLREADGLGPLYIRAACAACHQDDGRGPGVVGKMAVVQADGVTPAQEQSVLQWGATQRPYTVSGATRPLLGPEGIGTVRVTYRFPPAVFGRGYMEAVADEEIERLGRAAATRTGAIRGRIHRVGGEGGEQIGRFGHKARIATLDEFTADALQGDMGITSPSRPAELPNPDGLTDDSKPGVDASSETLNLIADYMRLLEIPPRAPASARGEALFAELSCATCHVPSLKTRADYRVAALAGIKVDVYTDFLLHDMGRELSDSVVEGSASGREWRTAPMIGLRFSPAFMHDGRARSLGDAVLAHAGEGSEADESVALYNALSAGDRSDLLEFVSGL